MSNSSSESCVQKEPEFRILKLEQIIAPVEPVRDDLKLEEEGFVDSVSTGQIIPLNVRPSGNKYEVINGHRRLGALKKAGKVEARCLVWDGLTDLEVRLMRFTENFDRADPNDIEIAKELDKMLDDSGMTFEELSEKIHRSKAWISNHLGILGTKYEKPVEKKRIALDTAMVGIHFESSNEANDLFVPKTIDSITDKIIDEGMSRPRAKSYIEETIKKQKKRKDPARCYSCTTKVYRDPNTLKNVFKNGTSLVLCKKCLGDYDSYLISAPPQKTLPP